MKPSNNCVNLVKSFEGFKSQPYADIVGIPTIGYGSTHYEDGTKVTLDDPAITEDQAANLLLIKLTTFGNQVTNMVTTSISQNQFDALTDFVYNLGSGSLHSSTLLKLLNSGDSAAAANEFPKWDKAGGNVVAGLLRRRMAEQALFLLPDNQS